jgi:hypothetical protein
MPNSVASRQQNDRKIMARAEDGHARNIASHHGRERVKNLAYLIKSFYNNALRNFFRGRF